MNNMKVVTVYFKKLSQLLPEGTRKTTSSSVRTANV